MDEQDGVVGVEAQGLFERAEGKHFTLEQRIAALSAREQAADLSEREFCRLFGLDRSTLRAWERWQAEREAEQRTVDFFTSDQGLAFIHQLMVAMHLVFGVIGLGSYRHMELFLHLAGLDPFVASSRATQQRAGAAILDAIDRFGQTAAQTLAQAMADDLDGHRRPISIACDETYHPQPCFVAIEPHSGYIVVEKYEERCDSPTWILTMRSQLKELPVQVEQVVADQGGAIAALADHLDVPTSPDLMHLLQPLVAHIVKPLSRAAKRARTKNPDSEETQQLVGWQERVAQALKALNAAYHPVDLNDGSWRSTRKATEGIDAALDALDAVVSEAGLKERAVSALKKVRERVSSMIVVLGRAERLRKKTLLALAPEHQTVAEGLSRARYLRKMARSAEASERHALQGLACGLEAGSEAVLSALSEEVRGEVLEAVRRCGTLFERSSSCVEGRNGQLALKHHGLRQLSVARLRALTVVHNFWATRHDATTAAERFFGHKPPSLFSFLLDAIDFKAVPRTARKTRDQAFNG